MAPEPTGGGGTIFNGFSYVDKTGSGKTAVKQVKVAGNSAWQTYTDGAMEKVVATQVIVDGAPTPGTPPGDAGTKKYVGSAAGETTRSGTTVSNTLN